MAKERTTISLDAELYAAALAVCAPEKENRDFSNLCEQALREFLGARGELPADVALKAQLIATGEEIGFPTALETLRRKLRTTKAGAPAKTAA